MTQNMSKTEVTGEEIIALKDDLRSARTKREKALSTIKIAIATIEYQDRAIEHFERILRRIEALGVS